MTQGENMKLKTCPICRGEMPNINGRRYCSFGCWLCARDPKLCELAKKHGKLESVSNFQERSWFERVTSKESPDLLAQTIISELNHDLDEAGAFPEPRQLDRDFDLFHMKELFMITGWRPVNREEDGGVQ